MSWTRPLYQKNSAQARSRLPQISLSLKERERFTFLRVKTNRTRALSNSGCFQKVSSCHETIYRLLINERGGKEERRETESAETRGFFQIKKKIRKIDFEI
jgi:hypothetical protein